jgi:hypothetical protein
MHLPLPKIKMRRETPDFRRRRTVLYPCMGKGAWQREERSKKSVWIDDESQFITIYFNSISE